MRLMFLANLRIDISDVHKSLASCCRSIFRQSSVNLSKLPLLYAFYGKCYDLAIVNIFNINVQKYNRTIVSERY